MNYKSNTPGVWVNEDQNGGFDINDHVKDWASIAVVTTKQLFNSFIILATVYIYCSMVTSCDTFLHASLQTSFNSLRVLSQK